VVLGSRHCGTYDIKGPWDSKIFSMNGFKENLGPGSYGLDTSIKFLVFEVSMLDRFEQSGTLGFKVLRSSRAVSRV
jgi:hypothetical protein